MKQKIELLNPEEKEEDPIGMQIVSLVAQVAEYERDNEKKAAIITELEQEIQRLRACVHKWERIAHKAQRELADEWKCIINTEAKK